MGALRFLVAESILASLPSISRTFAQHTDALFGSGRDVSEIADKQQLAYGHVSHGAHAHCTLRVPGPFSVLDAWHRHGPDRQPRCTASQSLMHVLSTCT